MAALTSIASAVADYLNRLPVDTLVEYAVSRTDLTSLLERTLLGRMRQEDLDRYRALLYSYADHFTSSDCGILLARIQSRLTPDRARVLEEHRGWCLEQLASMWARVMELVRDAGGKGNSLVR